MVRTSKLRQQGGSCSVTLPRDLTDRFRLNVGAEVLLLDIDDGILISPFNPVFDQAMRAYAHTAGGYRNALRELAR